MFARRPARDFGTVPSADEIRAQKQHQTTVIGGTFCEQCGAILDPLAATRERRMHRTGACQTATIEQPRNQQ